MDTVPLSPFAANMKRLREAKELTFADLERLTGLTDQALINIERGHNSPVLATATRIAEALGVTLAEMVTPPPAEGFITLPRTGQRPLTFAGELLVSSAGKELHGGGNARWHDLAVYRLAEGRLLIHLSYQTQWPGEVGHSEVHTAANAVETATLLLNHDPTARVKGYPPGRQFEVKQKALLDDVRSRYTAQVSALLSARPDLFAETLD